MKLWSKEALVLGGVYGVLETPFSLFGFEYISDALFLLFIGCVIMLCFNKTPKFITYVIHNCPKISYYLCSIGWIPYVILIVSISVFGFISYTGYNGALLVNIVLWLAYSSLLLSILSLAIAFIKDKRKNII